MYVVIGANGFLGSYLIKNILEKTGETIIAVSNSNLGESENNRIQFFQCDITKQRDVFLLNEKIEKKAKIIYLAAYHHPDLVMQNPKVAWDVNITSLAFFLNTIENVECFFYPSTDTVYGEGNGGIKFKEQSNLNPVNLYGHHKVLAEKMVTTYGYNVVRFPFLIGPSLLKHKKHFYDEIATTLLEGKTIDMYMDSIRSSLDFNQAAFLLIQLMEEYTKDMPQIINIASDEGLSKYDIGLKIAKSLGASEKLVIPVSVTENKEIFKTPRANITLLDNTLLKKILGLKNVHINI